MEWLLDEVAHAGPEHLDLGAGTGGFAKAIAPHVARVVGVDVSHPMVDAMRNLHR